MISTIRGRLADGARWTIVRSYRLDLESETELRIQVRELLFVDAYLSKAIYDKKLWYMLLRVSKSKRWTKEKGPVESRINHILQ